MQLLFPIYLFLLSMFLALIEIEIEGKNGWAVKTETFRKDLTKIRFIKRFAWSHEITGYHLFLNTFLLMMFHLPYFFGYPFTLGNELQLLGYFLLFGVTWDLLWFVMNPHYGIKKFKKDQIPWFSQNKWIFGDRVSIPHLVHLGAGLVLVCGSAYLQNSNEIMKDYVVSIGIFILLSLITIALSPIYHRLYFKLRS